MEVHTVRNKKVLKAGWKLGRSSLAIMKQLGMMLPDPRNTTMLVDTLPDMNSSDGIGILRPELLHQPL